MAAKRGSDVRKQKERRQKAIAIGGGILLLALVAIQGPKTLKLLRGSSSVGPPPAATATTTVSTGLSPALAAASFRIVEPSGQPRAGLGQLASLDRFTSRDPFVQQIRQDSDEASSAASLGTSVGPAESKPANRPAAAPRSRMGKGGGRKAPRAITAPQRPSPTTPASPVVTTPAPPVVTTEAPDTTTTPPGTTAPDATAPALANAVIATNGREEPVAVGASFPKADPWFRLVSATAKGARIAIDDGTYASGAETVVLMKSKPLTLMNVATGVRYQLRLISVS